MVLSNPILTVLITQIYPFFRVHTSGAHMWVIRGDEVPEPPSRDVGLVISGCRTLNPKP